MDISTGGIVAIVVGLLFFVVIVAGCNIATAYYDPAPVVQPQPTYELEDGD